MINCGTKRILFGASLVLVCAVVLAQPLAAQIRAALVKEVDQPARQAVTIRKNTSSSIMEDVYTVPAGKKLVVEHMNCSVLGSGDIYVGIFKGGLSHANIIYSVPLVSASSAGVRILDGQTKLYFDPGAVVTLRIWTFDQTTCSISGYTVDITP